jgi:hypothetical protein
LNRDLCEIVQSEKVAQEARAEIAPGFLHGAIAAD